MYLASSSDDPVHFGDCSLWTSRCGALDVDKFPKVDFLFSPLPISVLRLLRSSIIYLKKIESLVKIINDTIFSSWIDFMGYNFFF